MTTQRILTLLSRAPCRLVAIATLVSSLALSPAQAAEPALTDAQVEQIRTYFTNAKARRDAQDYQGAIDYLQKAIAIRSEPWLILALAQNYESAGKDELAISHYRLCTTGSADDTTRLKAQEAIERLERKATLGWLQIDSNPRDVEVAIDAKRIVPGPGRKFELTEGTYLVTVSASGFESATNEVVIKRGKTNTLEIRLARVIVAPKPPEPTPQKPPAPSPAPDNSPGVGAGTWVVIGTGIALVGGGVATYLIGDGKHSDVEDAQADAGGGVAPMTRVQAQTLLDDGETLKTVGIICGSVGLGAVITGIVLATTSGGEPKSSVNVVGGPAGSLFGLGLSGRF